MVGASDGNLFSRRAFAQYERIAEQPIAIVNPRSPIVHGVETVARCQDVEGGIDLALMLTPQRFTIASLRDAAEAGASAAAIMSQGWAEEDEDGRVRQAELVAVAEQLGITLLGPNHLGFVNLWDRSAATALGLNLPAEPGAFALVSQSGAVGSSLVGYASRHDVNFSFVVTTGNEAMVSIADVVDYLVDDEHTKAIGVFAETIRKPATFIAAARRAAELGKAIVVLKAGSSELAARTAQAHTGALVGDDRVIDAMLRQEGVIRVRTLEDLVTIGNLCAHTGPLKKSGVAVLSVSGGACDLIADRGQEVGLDLPALSASAYSRLAEVLPPYGHPQNPLDVTGGALAKPEVWRRGIEVMADEQEIGFVGIVTSLPTSGEPQRDMTFQVVGEALRETGLAGAIFPQLDQDQSEYVRQVKAASGIENVLPSVDRFTVAAAALSRWSTWLRERVAPVGAHEADATSARLASLVPGAAVSEYSARGIAIAGNVPLVPASLATDAAEAIAAARDIQGPVVLKICSAEVAHKTELGGVLLDVAGDDAVGAGFEALTERARQAGVNLEGVLVSPFRKGGIELLVGVTRDPDWGLVLAVAFGGALVELLDDSALRLLPVSRAEVLRMLGELRGSRLLSGFRGSDAVDLDQVANAVVAIADTALALGPDLESFEVNPLRVSADAVEGLDVLITVRASS
ncbi:acyl-CoA synthetase [Subtercola boreus]|uniref:Acyl-CoA synthetase n=2 Tax=Subtercola boreus TaxID=120213 RepID=A0A3E0VR34_9MICO|nr:acyl-CoA synthetase [Subtercola boreus]